MSDDAVMETNANRSVTCMRRIRHAVEDALFAVALRVIPRLPRSWVVGLSRTLGAAACMLARRDVRIAMTNLDLAYGAALSASEKRVIVRQVFRTFALTVLDYFWFSRDTGNRIRRHVTVDESVIPWLRGGAFVAVTAHFGNWEVFGHVAAMQGVGLASVAKPVKNPWIDARVNRLRESAGQRIIPREGALRTLVKVLRDGGAVALLLDQDTRAVDGGVFVDFFGIPAPVSGAAAGLAIRMQTPLVTAFCRNEGDGTYRCYVRDVLRPDALRGASAAEVTARIAQFIEAEIRRYPGQWLWTYKRWKRRQPGSDPARYPFYADC